MELTCPRPGCGQTFKSLQGVKMHMSRKHGGYDDADLAAVVGGSPGESSVRERMASFADSIPGGPSAINDTPVSSAIPDDTQTPPLEPEGKRVKATPKKAKKLIGSMLQRIVEALKIEPDDDDKETLEEAGDFLSSLFGVEFSVPQSKYVVESRFWAFVWVVGIIGVMFVKHNFKTIIMGAVKGSAVGVPPSGTESSDS